MKTDEAIKRFCEKHPGLVVNAHSCCLQESLELTKAHIKTALSFFKQSGFEVLMDLTGVDYSFQSPHTKVLYFLHNPLNYQRVRIFVLNPRGVSLPSVTDLWEGADWYERELFDLFGVHFEDHPGLKRILMPDNWTGHPLRKDYPLTEKPVLFKHGVKPKVPSEIIPYVKNDSK